MVEEEFFQQQTQWALDGIKRRTLETVDSLKKNTDVSPLIRRRPKTSVLAAAAGGLVAGFLMTPKPGVAEAERAKAIAAVAHHGGLQRPPTFASHIESEVLRTLRPALRAFAASAAGMLFANVHLPLGHHSGHESAEDLSELPRHAMQI